MERNERHTRRWTTRNLLLAGGLSLGLAVGGVAVAAGPGATGAVPFTSGGVGETERAELDDMSQAYNLRVVTARPTGEYLSAVNVDIRNGQGASVLNTVTEGPWLLVRLPPGTYTVQATAGNQTRQTAIRVDRDHQARVLMHLPDVESSSPMAAATMGPALR